MQLDAGVQRDRSNVCSCWLRHLCLPCVQRATALAATESQCGTAASCTAVALWSYVLQPLLPAARMSGPVMRYVQINAASMTPS
jgi:hypothetical protein